MTARPREQASRNTEWDQGPVKNIEQYPVTTPAQLTVCQFYWGI